jgi:hypothetical protein
VVPLASLPIERIISDRADDAKEGEAPGQVRGCLTWWRRVLVVQLFYNGSESVTRGAKVRVSCQMKRVADKDQFTPAEQMNLLCSACASQNHH